MRADQTIRYLDTQQQAIQGLVAQLDEIQVAFNAQFDAFKARHDARLDALTGQVFDRLRENVPGTISPALRQAITKRLPEEQARLEERRRKVRDEYLPQRQQAADAVLQEAQAEIAALRELNPRLDQQEEMIKRQKAKFETQLAALNDEIRSKSRGLGVLLHFLDITRADRERQRIIGRLESIANLLRNVRQEWEQERTKVEKHQTELEKKYQLESIAVARLQSELDQLDDDQNREDLALRRAVRGVLDDLKEPAPGSDPELAAGIEDMIELNIQTDDYQGGLAAVGGFIGLLRGIDSGLDAIEKSIDGLAQEQKMHSAYLKPLSFGLPKQVETFHNQWPALDKQFADETVMGSNPADFSDQVRPILEGPLSQANIERMFDDLGKMIEQATAAW